MPAALRSGDLLLADRAAFAGAGGLIHVNPQTGEQALLSFGDQFTNPEAPAQAPNGDLFVVDSAAAAGAGAIFRLHPADSSAVVVTSGGHFAEPCGLTLGADGFLYVVDRAAFGGSGGVIRVDPSSGEQIALSWGNYLVDPCGIAQGPDGSLFVADPGTVGGAGGVIQIDPKNGAQSLVTGGQLFQNPTGLVAASDGDLFVADRSAFGGGGGVIRVRPSDGQQTAVAAGGFFDTPRAVAWAPDGGLFVVDSTAGGGSGAVIHVNLADGGQTIVTAGGFCNTPVGILMVASPFRAWDSGPLEVRAAGELSGQLNAEGPGPVAYEIVAGPAAGTLQLDPGSGTFTYQAVAPFDGMVHFSFRVTDGGFLSNEARVTIHVGADFGTVSLRTDSGDLRRRCLFIEGTSDNDWIQVQRQSGGRVLVRIKGVVTTQFPLRDFTRIIVEGQAGNDRITIAGLKKPAQLLGGGGADTLIGSPGADALLGGPGQDVLAGRAGRDLLLGGADMDWLAGGANSDVLLGGTSDLESDADGLAAVRLLWNRQASYARRVQGFMAETIDLVWSDDGQVNEMLGGRGFDLFCGDPALSRTDRNHGEEMG